MGWTIELDKKRWEGTFLSPSSSSLRRYQRGGPVVSVEGGLIVPPNPPVGDKKVAAPWRQESRRSTPPLYVTSFGILHFLLRIDSCIRLPKSSRPPAGLDWWRGCGGTPAAGSLESRPQ